MKNIKLYILFLLITCSVFSETLTGKVLYVSDGDTLTMDVGGQKKKIRFYGIDAPEKTQPGGLEAKEFVLERIRDKIIEVDVSDTDRYNRIIGKIYYDNGKYLNKEVVKSGNAWWYQQYAKNDIDLKDSMVYAKNNKLGLWQGNNIIAPWDWRRGERGITKEPTQVEGVGNLVYVTKTGKKYHNKGCRYLKSIAASYTVEEAKNKGYTACSQFR